MNKNLHSHGRRTITILVLGLACFASGGSVLAADALFVYGPGGPAPAMKEAAAAFQRQHGVQVEVIAGPTPSWIDKARQNADLIYSGSETMMTDFVVAMEGRIDEKTITPLYLRPMSILVRPGNPRRITGFRDLLKPGTKILVVNGAGQNGAWEDIAGRKGDIGTVRQLRRNIVSYAPNSAAARTTWIEKTDVDVWLIWNIWQVANPQLADTVPIEPDYAIYRDTGIALSKQGAKKPLARQFVDFLQSKEGSRIFAKWGWKT